MTSPVSPSETIAKAKAAATEFFRNDPIVPEQSPYDAFVAGFTAALVDVPAVESATDLDARMKAAGMYTIAEMMGVTPLTKWKSNPAINTLDAFSEWLDRKVSEYLTMKAGYDLGDKSTDDELYEWVEAHAAVFGTIRDQFKIVSAALSTRKGSAGDGAATGTSGGDHG